MAKKFFILLFYFIFFTFYLISESQEKKNENQHEEILKQIQSLRKDIESIDFSGSQSSINTLIKDLDIDIHKKETTKDGKGKKETTMSSYLKIIKYSAEIIRDSNTTICNTKEVFLKLIDYLIMNIKEERKITREEIDKKIKIFFSELDSQTKKTINKFFYEFVKDSNKIIKKIVIVGISTAVLIKGLFWLMKIFKRKYKRNKNIINYKEFFVSSGISLLSIFFIIKGIKE
jgi:hypothetical protein